MSGSSGPASLQHKLGPAWLASRGCTCTWLTQPIEVQMVRILKARLA